MPSEAFAIFGDVHGNWQALKAVWDELDRLAVRHRLCLGDLVGYGADAVRCVDWIRETETPCVQGNHDYYVATGKIPDFLHEETAITLKYALDTLGNERRAYLNGLPTGLEFDEFEAVHASLPHVLEWTYIANEKDAKRHLNAQKHRVGFVGHTHQATVYADGDPATRVPLTARLSLRDYAKVVVNPGAVGQSRDRDSRASYALFGVKDRTVEFRRVSYDVDGAASACDAAGFHPLLGQRLKLGM